MTNKQKIKELQNQFNKIEAEHNAFKFWLMQNADFSSVIEQAIEKNVTGLSKKQVQDLIYKLTLIAHKMNNRKGNLSQFTAKLIELIMDEASEQKEQEESEETKNECDI